MATLVKTKDLMIDVARQLFARFGVQNTTMNDIADAAQRGRRTLYTYFKNKEDIYQAVIERELQHLRRELEVVRRLPLSPDEKLIRHIYTHLEAMKTVVLRNGTLRADFFRDISSVERARAGFDLYEQRLLEEILTTGVDQGVFEVPHIPTMAYLLQNAIKGLEVPFISGHVRHRSGDAEYQQVRENVCHLIMRGIRRQEE